MAMEKIRVWHHWERVCATGELDAHIPALRALLSLRSLRLARAARKPQTKRPSSRAAFSKAARLHQYTSKGVPDGTGFPFEIHGSD